MEKERQQKIHELLKRGLKMTEAGEDLPVEWAREFFPPERWEYELVYRGKNSEEQILADTMAVPLQPMSTFGTNGVDWHNKLIFGDNLQAMKTLLTMKEQGELVNADGTPGVRLIYIDPPFATKQEFRGSQDQKAYQDKIVGAHFLEFLRKRLIFLKKLLADDGAIYLHLDWKKGHYMKTLMDEIFNERNFRNEIIVRRIRKNIRERERVKTLNYGHDVIYFYAKSDAHLILPPTKLADREGRWHAFDAPGIRKGMDYPLFGHKPPTGRHWMLSKDRAEDMIREKTLRKNLKSGKPQYYIEPSREDIRDTIWADITASSFTTGYPTEKSEDLLRLIIEASSRPGDIVLDCFAGSGTTCAVAEKLNRHWIGIDCGKFAIYTIQKRMLNLQHEVGRKIEKLKPKPFTLYNAGLYDFETLRQLPWEGWRSIALQFFECKDEPHKIRGFQLDGKRQGSSVLVFDHFHKGSINRDTISDIHTSIGKQIGDRCFIIAPRGVFLFQEDFIELDGVRYYALRIPYSYITELHRREFSALTQPNDEMAVNETVEAVGFDFIQPPLVELEMKSRDGSTLINIRKFESRARLRGEEKISKHDALSMVMVDLNYDGKIFDLDYVFYAHDLKAKRWEIELPLKNGTGDAMLVFLDIYGNESWNLIKKDKLMPRLSARRGRK